jgi:hypothetical protein
MWDPTVQKLKESALGWFKDTFNAVGMRTTNLTKSTCRPAMDQSKNFDHCSHDLRSLKKPRSLTRPPR